MHPVAYRSQLSEIGYNLIVPGIVRADAITQKLFGSGNSSIQLCGMREIITGLCGCMLRKCYYRYYKQAGYFMNYFHFSFLVFNDEII
jgi:hypothetical protein